MAAAGTTGGTLERFLDSCSKAIPAVLDEVSALRGREEGERGAHQVDDLGEGARPCRAEEGFQFGEGLFNRIEVGAVGREEAEGRAHGGDRRLHGRLLVDREVVEDDHVAGPQRRHQHLLDVGEEGGIVEGAGEDGRGAEARATQRRDDRVGFPVPTRREVAQPDAFRTAAIAPNQIGGDAGLIDKMEAVGLPQRLPRLPAPPRRGHVRPALLVGVYRFF